ncbi:MAG TPA: hypothetical protein VFT82_02230 [Candidatus Paceibacterota bacterium]|nr:hypothetical protein [Candidatus Paceibacterota bacterium]
MVKYLILLALIGGAVYFSLNFDNFVTTGLNSPEFGATLSHGASWSVAKTSEEEIDLSRSRSDGQKDYIFIQKFQSPENTSLSVRLSRDTPFSTSNEKHAHLGPWDGITFSWTSDHGIEAGFVFASGQYLYVVGTEGLSDTSRPFIDEFSRVASTLRVE